MLRLLLLTVGLLAIGCGSQDDAGAQARAAATANSAGASNTGAAKSGERQPLDSKASSRRVEVATIESAVAKLEFALPGEVDGAKDAMLAAALGGYVEKVFVSNGDAVKAGQILARIDAAMHTARLEQTQVEYAAAERELKRTKSMGDAVSAAQLDNADSRFAGAKAALSQANIAVDRAVIRAPFAGTISNLEIEVGEVAPPGLPILRLIQLDPVKVSLAVSDREVASLEAGVPVQVSTGAEANVYAGTISHVSPAADPRTRAFRVEVTVPNADGALKPGMIATVKVSREIGGEAIVVPQDWVVTSIGGLGVFLEAAGVATWRPIKVGAVVRDQVIVREGLVKGDRVISTGQRELVDGDKVLVAREGRCCTDGRVTFE
jgi:membrane fusion protein (multidrug efflux system)